MVDCSTIQPLRPAVIATLSFSPSSVTSSVTVDGRLRIELEFSQLSISALPVAPGRSPPPPPLPDDPPSRLKSRQEAVPPHQGDPNGPRIRDCVKCSSQHTRPPAGSIYPDIGSLPCQCRVPWTPRRENSMLIRSRTPSPPGVATARKDRRSKGKQVDRNIDHTSTTSRSPSLAPIRGRQFLSPSPLKREEGPSGLPSGPQLLPNRPPPAREQSVLSESISTGFSSRPRHTRRISKPLSVAVGSSLKDIPDRVVSVSDTASISSDAATYESPDEGRPRRRWYVVTKGTKVGIFKDWYVRALCSSALAHVFFSQVEGHSLRVARRNVQEVDKERGPSIVPSREAGW